MVELNNTNVYINGHEFFAVSMVSLEMSIRPLSHPAEEVFTITDHIRQMPNKFKLLLKLFDRWEDSDTLVETREEKLKLIQEWYKDRRLNRLSTDLGDYSNMLIVNVKVVEDNSSHTSFGVEIQMEEVLVAFLQPIEEQWYTDIDGKVYEQTPYESVHVDGTLTEPKPSEPEKKEWGFGHNLIEIVSWTVTLGGDDVEWRWPW